MVLRLISRNIKSKRFIILLLFCIVGFTKTLFLMRHKYGLPSYVYSPLNSLMYNDDVFRYLYLNLNPLFISLVSCKAFFEDEKSRVSNFCIVRNGSKKNRYFIDSLVAGCITGGIVSILPNVIFLFLSSIIRYSGKLDYFIDFKYPNIFSSFMYTNAGTYILLINGVFFLYGMIVALVTMSLKATLKNKSNIEYVIPFFVNVIAIFMEAFLHRFEVLKVFSYYGWIYEFYLRGEKYIYLNFFICFLVPAIVAGAFYYRRIKNDNI